MNEDRLNGNVNRVGDLVMQHTDEVRQQGYETRAHLEAIHNSLLEISEIMRQLLNIHKDRR